MAYAAVVSLKLTIQRLLNSCDQIPILPPNPEVIQLAYNEVESLEKILCSKESNNKRVEALERQIREAAFRLEDVLESAHVSDQHFLSQSQTPDGDDISYLAMEVTEEIDFFTETVKKIREQLSNTSLLAEEDDQVVSSRTAGIDSQRRLCIHNNVLFGIKDVSKSMTSTPNVRSLLCTGPHHQYPVPIYLDFSLLRVLDALTIRFYGFPSEVVKLVQLRYLAITYNGMLPDSISKLRYLQYLIVHHYLSIINYGNSRPYLPMEVWTMQELRHLEVMGSNMPDPSSEDVLLPNLLTLSGISTCSCTKEVLERIPNLKRLGIRTEVPLDTAEPFLCFNDLVYLNQLKLLKCSIVNLNLKLQVLGPKPPVPFFAVSLRKLTLSGLGFPWEHMSIVACLPNLEVLKLRCYAFRGPEWETSEGGFLQRRFLLIEDTDLEYWRADSGHFPN
ncbi:UNVERIFIED_CONTAM: hypothetical protein Sradi_2910600 [Sesamum radiatum]|uniref:Disease resistance R13L4/SHOC-2-like LRR domain-containing protein n=1 Tax=Sesamum radiatum TaxID=300843 RepID=A0AAW2RYM4_SESRA